MKTFSIFEKKDTEEPKEEYEDTDDFKKLTRFYGGRIRQRKVYSRNF